MLKISKAVLQNFADATQYEWLETNGLGGWSASTVIGAHTRRYHGLLMASVVPPADRMLLLSKLDETIVTGETRIELGANRYAGDVIHPNGHHYLESFTKNLFPQWVYEAEGIRLEKTIAAIRGENTVVVKYTVLQAPNPFTLELLPLVAARGYHSLQQAGPQLHWDAEFRDGIFHNSPDGIHHIYIQVPGSSYRHDPRWFNKFQYSVEQYRGLDHTEDLLNHGIFSVSLKRGDSLGIIISTEAPSGRDAILLLEKEEQRRLKLMAGQPDDETFRQLVLAADQFIVKRGENLKTIIAGYHWFTDWGRDTMISLPGLTLATGRFGDAKKILAAFAGSVSQGMLPNRFQDNGEAPEYNNVDGTLWYFIAIHKYLLATDDREFVLKELLPVLKSIIDWHCRGTRYNIHAGNDGLLFAGEKGQQLTWMDARIGNWVVTPRMGKPVEIQALWYNALCIYSALLQLNGETGAAGDFAAMAATVKDSFNKLFWYAEGGYLYDNIDENGNPDPSLRPNQLFAVTLPYEVMDDPAKAISILNITEKELVTPVGLRSLPASDVHYVHQYGGDQWHRDAAYHEGTVWSWLLGTYVDAVIRLNAGRGRVKAKKIIRAFQYHLAEGCIGSVSEIFDADAPHHPRGCVAQAWAVAEILRVIKEYELFTKLKKTRQTAVPDF